MTPLITINDISALEEISANVNFNKKVRPAILNAQEYDVRPLVGEQFWVKLSVSAANNVTVYPDLWNEKTYTYQGEEYQHPGLKAVIVQYAYARYIATANNHHTAFGIVAKTDGSLGPNFSTQTSSAEISRLVKMARADAEMCWGRVKSYLERFREQYPLYKCAGAAMTHNGVRINKIGKPKITKVCRRTR